jgi:hypothetical protein
MRKQIGYVALVIAVGILVWALGYRKRTEEELNRVYYPTLYSEVIRAIDPVSKQAVSFEIKWHEEVGPGLKGTEPTRLLKYPDKSQAVTLVRRWDRKEYSFDIRSPGFNDYTLTVKPADWYMNSEVADQTREVVLTPVEAKRGNTPEVK